MAEEKLQNGTTFKWQDEIQNIYYNCAKAGSFYGPVQLHMVLKKYDPKCRLKDVISWIRNQETYNVHRGRRDRFERRKLVRLRPYETLSMDLVFIQDLAKYNSNFSYILTIICQFSNKAWAYPLKNKTQAEVSKHLDSLFAEHDGEIVNINSDKGIEFCLDKLYDKYHINHYSVKSLLKSCHVENFNRTLQNRLYRAMTANSTLRWITLLDSIVKSYNETPSSRLYGFSPNQSLIPANAEYLRQKFREEREKLTEKYKNFKSDLVVGSSVYVVKPKTKFMRGYKANFEDKVRKITACLPTCPPTFKVQGLHRSFYRNELSLTGIDDFVGKKPCYYISKERLAGGRQLRSQNKSGQIKEYLIKSYTEPEFEKWVTDQDLQKLKDEKLLCYADIRGESESV